MATIKDLIYDARGNGRNMSEFARDIGISASQLYRIAASDFSRPVRSDTLLSIAECKAEGSVVTFEKLVECVGTNFVGQNKRGRLLNVLKINHNIDNVDPLETELLCDITVREALIRTVEGFGEIDSEPPEVIRAWIDSTKSYLFDSEDISIEYFNDKGPYGGAVAKITRFYEDGTEVSIKLIQAP